jgi:hypothetical protein
MHVLLRNGAVALACLGLMGGCGGRPGHLALTTPKAAVPAAGAVQITMSSLINDRAVAAVLADVAFYRITLSGNGLPSPRVKQCAAPANANGKVSARFDDLAPGTYTLQVEALDAAMAVLGSDARPGTVTPGLCTYIDLHIKLQPTLVSPTTGSLGARVTVEPGDVVTRPVGDCPANEGFVSIDGSTCPAPAAPPTPRP